MRKKAGEKFNGDNDSTSAFRCKNDSGYVTSSIIDIFLLAYHNNSLRDLIDSFFSFKNKL